MLRGELGGGAGRVLNVANVLEGVEIPQWHQFSFYFFSFQLKFLIDFHISVTNTDLNQKKKYEKKMK